VLSILRLRWMWFVVQLPVSLRCRIRDCCGLGQITYKYVFYAHAVLYFPTLKENLKESPSNDYVLLQFME
jgi:hypothetical protein